MFMGNEFGQFIEWNFRQSLDWHLLDFEMHRKLKDYVRDMNRLYRTEKAMHEVDFSYDGFEWINCDDRDNSIVSFLRKGARQEDMLLFMLIHARDPRQLQGRCSFQYILQGDPQQ